MTQYLVAIHLPDDFDPAAELQSTRDAISALNVEMVQAGVRVFVGGLEAVGKAVSVRPRAGGPIVTDGPYIETKEHVGGFWVLECATREEAIEWGRKAAVACGVPAEVRAFQ
ncbi:MAG: YciI family protein [Devosia sp.]